MQRKKRRTRYSGNTEQSTLFGTIEGIEKLVNKPEVIEHDGQRVVKLVVTEEDDKLPEYTETALDIARKLQPEVQSTAKPPWMRADWQAKKRKEREGFI